MAEKNTAHKISFIGLLQVVALLTLLFSVATLFNQYQRYLELFSHFRLQYLLSALVCTVIFVFTRHFKSATLMALTVVLNAVYILPWYIGAAPTATENSTAIKLILSNVNTANRNYPAFIDLIHAESPDIFVVQEVDEKWLTQLRRLEAIYPYQYSVPRNDNFGIAIFSRHPFDKVTQFDFSDFKIPSLKAQLTLAQQPFTLITTHPLPPVSAELYQARNHQLKQVAQKIKETDGPLILLGDLNITMWSNDYKPLVSGTAMHNARKGFGLLPSWPAMVPVFFIPIDHCLVSSHFSVQSIRTGPRIGSDHLPLIVKLALSIQA